jgi:tetratricopeptide (TPR) repeat protein
VLVLAFFLAGIGGGLYFRHQRSTPTASGPTDPQPETEVVSNADDSPQPQGNSVSRTTTSDPYTNPDDEPVAQPPADLAERKRIENRFGVLFRRGYENYGAERYAAAAEDFQQAVQTAPYLAEGHYMLGQVYRRMSFDELAEESYRRSLRLMPDFEPAQQEFCKLLHERGAYEQANAILLEMQQKAPNDSFVLGEMAINLLGLGQPQRAIPLLQKYNQVTARQGWGYAQLGRAYELLGETKSAVQNYQQALEIDPYLSMTYHWYGLLLAREGDEAQSRELLDRYDQLRKLQTMEHDLNMALLRNADDLPTIVRLAQVRKQLGRGQEALAALKRARRIAPNDPDLARLWDQWTRDAPPASQD